MKRRSDVPLTAVIDRNVEHLERVREKQARELGLQDKIADGIASFAGSMWAVYAHLLLFGSWLALNSGLIPGFEPFDPYPFVMLAMFASVEAIFLSTFVLINQNRMGRIADQRADLDLHMTLLTEHELTRLIRMTRHIASHLGLDIRDEVEDIEHIQQDVRPDKVLERLENPGEAPPPSN